MRTILPRAVDRFAADDAGAALVEYGLLVVLIALGALAAITTFGTKVTALFTATDGKLPNS